MTDKDGDSGRRGGDAPPDQNDLESRALRIIRAVESPQADLPTLPTMAIQISQLVRSDTSSAQDLERLIMTDPALTGNILAVANSAFFGLRETVTSIRQAVVLLGFREIQTLVLGVSVLRMFNRKLSEAGLSMMDLWMHAVGVAAAAAALAAGAPRVAVAEYAFTAGLLHDLGKPLLMSRFPEDFAQAAVYAREQGCSFYEAERRVNGVTHDVLGDLFCRASSFPEDLLAGVGNHHEPDFEAEPAGLDVIVHLADALVVRIGDDWRGGLPPAQMFPEAATRLGLDLETARGFVDRAVADVDSIIEALI
jgi:putative nucleotidyltransferase with HDIG domain